MGRRRKKGLADELIALPWQISVLLAIGAFIGLRWILPGFLSQGPVLAGLRSSLNSLSWIALCAFGFLAALAAVRQKTEAGIDEGRGASPRRGQKLQPFALSADPWAKDPPALPLQPSNDAVIPEPPVLAPTRWSVEALRTLEWKRFEILCAKYYEAVGFKTEILDAGPDGGIDVKLFKIDPSKPLAVVQCKAWNTNQVGVKEIRELLGVMAHAKVARGIFVTTGTYTKDALDFGAANPIQLLDGAAFEKKILELPAEKQEALLELAFEGDYRTPTCASCGVKMVVREGKRGRFWGCTHYPRCKNTLPMRE
jgi:restriction system protein